MERLTSCVLASCCLLAMGCASQKLDQSKYQVQFPDTEKIDLTVATLHEYFPYGLLQLCMCVACHQFHPSYSTSHQSL